MLKNLLRNWTLLFSFAYILLLVITAVFCYLMAPDSSTYARQSIPQIANLYPGEKVHMIRSLVPDFEEKSFLSRVLYGDEIHYEYLPYDKIDLNGDEAHIKVYSHGDSTLDLIQNTHIQSSEVDTVIKSYYLGTDKLGRDILSRLMVGARVSLSVGLVAVLISITLGLFIGSMGGYFGGGVDRFVMWFINVFWAIPTILLVFAIVLAIGKGFWQIFIAIGITMWVGPARVIRGQIMSLKENNYIKAAKVLGLSSTRVILHHILPNILGILVVLSAANFATAILIEAGLSFLGVGIQPPMTSWGLMVKEQYNYLITDNPVPTLVPGLAIMLSVLSFNIVGNALRDYFDVKSE